LDYKDYYQILGVPKQASQDEIKRSYRKLARKYHPDVSKEPDAEERFKELGEAYEVLKDPEKRAAYDQLGADWKAGQEGFKPPPNWNDNFEFTGGGYTTDAGQSADFSDFFESLFGRRPSNQEYAAGANRRTQPLRGEDSHAKIHIELADAYQGVTRSISLRTNQLDENHRPQLVERTLNIKIPKGIRKGQSIRLPNQGNPGFNGGEAGDLYLEIEFNPHPLYSLEGRDVSLKLPIAPWEAALGTKVKVPTPAGEVEMKIPANSSSGKRLRLKGRGLPSQEPGDFYVTLEIVLPNQLSDTEKALYESLQQAAANFNPRASLGEQS
jgi:curved DNA-binding protein